MQAAFLFSNYMAQVENVPHTTSCHSDGHTDYHSDADNNDFHGDHHQDS